MGDSEEGHMLNVRVMFGGVGDNVVDIVVALPPAEAEAAQEVGDDYSNDSVESEGVRYSHMAGVVGGEDKLVPEHAEEEPAGAVPAPMEA